MTGRVPSCNIGERPVVKASTELSVPQNQATRAFLRVRPKAEQVVGVVKPVGGLQNLTYLVGLEVYSPR